MLLEQMLKEADAIGEIDGLRVIDQKRSASDHRRRAIDCHQDHKTRRGSLWFTGHLSARPRAALCLTRLPRADPSVFGASSLVAAGVQLVLPRSSTGRRNWPAAEA